MGKQSNVRFGKKSSTHTEWIQPKRHPPWTRNITMRNPLFVGPRLWWPSPAICSSVSEYLSWDEGGLMDSAVLAVAEGWMEEEALVSLLLTMAYELALIGCDERIGTDGWTDALASGGSGTENKLNCQHESLFVVLSSYHGCCCLVNIYNFSARTLWHFCCCYRMYLAFYLFIYFLSRSSSFSYPRDRPPAPVNHRE